MEELFLETPKLTDAQNLKKRERALALSRDPVLRELFVMSCKTRILDILALLSERKFEEAYAQVKVIEALQDMQFVLENSLEKVDPNQKADNSSVKY